MGGFNSILTFAQRWTFSSTKVHTESTLVTSFSLSQIVFTISFANEIQISKVRSALSAIHLDLLFCSTYYVDRKRLPNCTVRRLIKKYTRIGNRSTASRPGGTWISSLRLRIFIVLGLPSVSLRMRFKAAPVLYNIQHTLSGEMDKTDN